MYILLVVDQKSGDGGASWLPGIASLLPEVAVCLLLDFPPLPLLPLFIHLHLHFTTHGIYQDPILFHGTQRLVRARR